jgi:hypothetical protein
VAWSSCLVYSYSAKSLYMIHDPTDRTINRLPVRFLQLIIFFFRPKTCLEWLEMCFKKQNMFLIMHPPQPSDQVQEYIMRTNHQKHICFILLVNTFVSSNPHCWNIIQTPAIFVVVSLVSPSLATGHSRLGFASWNYYSDLSIIL